MDYMSILFSAVVLALLAYYVNENEGNIRKLEARLTELEGGDLTKHQKTGVCFYGDNAENVMSAVKANSDLLTRKPKCQRGTPMDCGDIPKDCPSGIYTIYTENVGEFNVYCEMNTDGRGWTVFQRRENGDVDFYLGWEEYKNGFGNLNREFWLGNTYLHTLTSQGRYELRVDLEDFDNNKAYAKYKHFYIGNEASNFKLSIGQYSGNAGDSLNYHHNMEFSTKDNDNDIYHENCAVIYSSGWWNKDCVHSNLNGEYFSKTPTGAWKGVLWYHWKGKLYSLKRSEMMIRQK